MDKSISSQSINTVNYRYVDRDKENIPLQHDLCRRDLQSDHVYKYINIKQAVALWREIETSLYS